MEVLYQILEKFPINAGMLVYLLFLGYSYHEFMTSPTSDLLIKQNQINTMKNESVRLEEKINKMEEFKEALEVKKVELRQMIVELQNIKVTLQDDLDVPKFIKTTAGDAKNLGLKVMSFNPSDQTKSADNYKEQIFIVVVRGIFAQIVSFFETLSKITEIVRIDDFNIAPVGAPQGKYIELEASLSLKVFKYVATEADNIQRKTQEVGSGGARSLAESQDSSVPGAPANQGTLAPKANP